MSGKKSEEVQSHISERFDLLKKVGSGAYGHVWKVQQKQTQKVYALKKIFDAFQHSTDAQRTYREIEILQQIDHPNIVKLYETMPAENNRDVYLLFQFMESDLHNAIGDNILKDAHFRYITYQIAKSLKYLHSGLIIHRDLKPSNVLINSDCKIKLCDFGLVRSLVNAHQGNPVLTEGVATRWYRAPQVLLGSKCYSTPADIWSFGCIIFEAIVRKPLFAGNSTLDQLQKIVTFTGIPSDEDIDSLDSELCRTMLKEIKVTSSTNLMKSISSQFQDLISKMIVFNPKKRITIEELLKHPIVKSFRKQQEEIVCKKTLTTTIDDNKKLSVDQYRKLIYSRKKITKQSSYSSFKHNPQINNNGKVYEKYQKPTINENFKPVIKKSLTKIRSCNNINDIIKNAKNNQIQISNPIRSSWKYVINNSEQALRSSGNFFKRSSNQGIKFVGKKFDEKTQIGSSEIPDHTDICSPKIKAESLFDNNLFDTKCPSFGTILWNSPKKNKINGDKFSGSPKNIDIKNFN